MARSLQMLSRHFHRQRLLLACSSVCPTYVNTDGQKHTYMTFDDATHWVYHDYKLTYQEMSSFINKRAFKKIKADQQYDEKNVTILGPNIAAASVILSIGGKIKIVGEDSWHKRSNTGRLPIPKRYNKRYIVEGIDASNVVLLHDCLDYLGGLEHLRYLNISESKYVDDWYLETLVEICPSLEALDIGNCPRITDNGLEILHRSKNLKALSITGCHGIKCAEAICTQLDEFCPDLNVIGVNSLHKLAGSSDLNDYENRTSRFMNWGYIMNTRLGLDNMVNYEELLQSQWEEVCSKQTVRTDETRSRQEDNANVSVEETGTRPEVNAAV